MDVLGDIYTSLINLPKPIRRVCYVQLFAFMGWFVPSFVGSAAVLLILEIRFPFLFYSTTYMGQVMAHELGKEPNHEYAIRRGELALLIYSIGLKPDSFLHRPCD